MSAHQKNQALILPPGTRGGRKRDGERHRVQQSGHGHLKEAAKYLRSRALPIKYAALRPHFFCQLLGGGEEATSFETGLLTTTKTTTKSGAHSVTGPGAGNILGVCKQMHFPRNMWPPIGLGGLGK